MLLSQRTAHDQRGVDLARVHNSLDFGLRLAENADCIALGFERALRLFHLALGNSVGSVEVFRARQFLAGQLEDCRGPDQS
jgi:hypothetical protein